MVVPDHGHIRPSSGRGAWTNGQTRPASDQGALTNGTRPSSGWGAPTRPSTSRGALTNGRTRLSSGRGVSPDHLMVVESLPTN